MSNSNLYVKLLMGLFSLGLNILGYYLIVHLLGWSVAGAIFCLFWANNITNLIYYKKNDDE